jgi:transcriptional regulator with XRE-family HTH domain
MSQNVREEMTERHARETASWIVLNPRYLTFLRALRGESQNDLAKRAGVNGEEIEHLEAGLDDAGIAVLMSIARAYTIPPENMDDDYMYYDPDDYMKGGKIGRRDKWGGKRPRRYKRWFHRHIKPHLKGVDTEHLPKKDHDEFERQWRALGCPDVVHIAKP